MGTQQGLSAGHVEELNRFRAEAAKLLKQELGTGDQESKNKRTPD
jgi:hypothetical protein